eukprot:TRINITY_DN12874_c0_g1_i1.p1 TRINITY_DN12874_c0_g1~~TRINITY_DN12874_c0_g1_i1.p1  ORF type:complete len:1033 (-),score=163.60 TRINITY_DN12874_c0_g1_i1:33-3131(-)
MVVGAQIKLGMWISDFKSVMEHLTQQRVKLTTTYVEGIATVKTLAWEDDFIRKLTELREEESIYVRKSLMAKGVAFTLSVTGYAIISLFGFLTFTLTGNSLTATIAFTSQALFGILTVPLTNAPKTVQSYRDGRAALRRLKHLLQKPELQVDFGRDSSLPPDSDEVPLVSLQHASFEYPSPSSSSVSQSRLLRGGPDFMNDVFSLENISMSVRRGEILGIVGGPASGKSSILMALLDQMDRINGEIKVRGSIAYVPPTPFLLPTTIKDNILFGSELCPSYMKAVTVSQIKKEPFGEKFEIGENGSLLTDAQKQKVSLARAFYSDRDVYLLDNPLRHLGEEADVIWEELIEGLQDKAIVMVLEGEHLKYLARCHKILFLEHGVMVGYGKFQTLLESNPMFKKLLPESVINPKEAVVNIEESKEKEERRSMKSKEHKSLFIWSANATPPTFSKIVCKQTQITGHIKENTWRARLSYFKYGNSVLIFLSILSFIGVGVLHVMTYSSLGESWKSTGNVVSELKGLWIYSSFVVGLICASLFRAVVHALVAVGATNNIALSATKQVFSAPTSSLETFKPAAIHHRLTSGLFTMDHILSYNLLEAGHWALGLASTLSFLVYMCYWLLVPIVLVMILFGSSLFFYFRTARSLKILATRSVSPVLSQFKVSTSGVVSVRSYGRLTSFLDHFYDVTNKHLSSCFLHVMCSRWVALRLDSLGLLLISIIASLVFFLPTSPETAGVVLSLSFTLLGSFQYSGRVLSETETLLYSVENILELCSDLPKEAEKIRAADEKISKNWPKGQIAFHNVKHHYKDFVVLDDVSFHAEPGEMIGIAGLPLSGKSTLLNTLTRVCEVKQGSITIDGRNIATLGLHKLRRNVSVIRGSDIFSGSLRENLSGPYGEVPDEALWQALTAVELDGIARVAVGGLDAEISSLQFDRDQRFLLAVARAILVDNRIIAIDENFPLSSHTEEVLGQVVQKWRGSHTILRVVSNMETIMDCDKAILLDRGRVARFDSPQMLFQDLKTLMAQISCKKTQGK